MSLPTTIDEVLSRLEVIIADAKTHNKRTGFFAALYHKVTSAVKDGIANGIFENGDRMGHLDVLFASRYIDALDCWENGRKLTESWKIAFEATKSSSPLILQHLLLGINAHINLDLGIAAVETIQDNALEGIHKDFNVINTIIGSLTNEVIRDIDRMSPFLSLIGLHANKTNSVLIQFSIGNARDGAWCFAEELSKSKGDAYTTLIEGRDKDIAKLASTILHSSGLLRFTVWLIHLFEWHNPKKIVAGLENYKKKFIKARMLPNR